MKMDHCDTGLKKVFGHLGQVQDISRNRTGSEESAILSPQGEVHAINAIAATRTLAQCGLTLLEAKRAVETVIAGDEIALALPKVVSRDRLVEDLATVGIQSSFL
jgi:putative transcriptional regulator